MDSGPKPRQPRRPTPAVVEREERHRLTRAWLDVYASDPAFLAELESLADAHAGIVAELDELAYAHAWSPPGLSWSALTDWPDELGPPPNGVDDYVTAVRDFATRWRLDLLPGEQGVDAIHDYCYARYWDGAPGREFASTVRSRPIAIQRLVPRAVSVSLTDAWDPTSETKGDAKARLGALLANLLDGELERVVRDHEAAGYVFADTRSAERLHLEWLYRKLVRGETTDELASDFGPAKPDGRSEKAILGAIRAVAQALGIPPPRQKRKAPRRL